MAWVPAESAVEELMPRLLPVEPCDLTEGSKQLNVQMLW
uniref:Gem nuclear organelle associated protein 2 n=3 Tax=Hominidae TaxID=9604 RepID=H0YCF4_HUMAN